MNLVYKCEIKKMMQIKCHKLELQRFFNCFIYNNFTTQKIISVLMVQTFI